MHIDSGEEGSKRYRDQDRPCEAAEAAKGLLLLRQYPEVLVGQDVIEAWDPYRPLNQDRRGVVLREVKWAAGTRLRRKRHGGMT